MSDFPAFPLNDRAQHLFKVLVQSYIRDGQPVGSTTLARSSGLELSSATIRNVMSDLEDIGLLHSPHTSAGRVPTEAGYRLFVDSLLQVERLDEQLGQRFREQFKRDMDSTTLVRTAGDILSRVTSLAGVVTIPRRTHRYLKQIEFVPLSDNRVLTILVFHPEEVQNKILQLEEPLSRDTLQQAANYLNELCGGKDIKELRSQLVTELDGLRENMNDLMRSAIELGGKAFSLDEEKAEDDWVVSGTENLMNYQELSDISRLRDLFNVFHSKSEMLTLLDRSLNADGVQIFIGQESGYQTFNDCSVITAPYSSDGEILGVLAVVGPTRIAYDKVIPVVDLTSRLLGAALDDV